MAIFVTGAAGYLGRELIGRASGAAGSFLHTPPPAELANAVRLDVRRADDVSAALADLRPETVIHTAYRPAGGDTHAVNVDGAFAVAAAAAEVGARLVHISTDLVFDGTLGRPYREEDEPRPVLEYGRQKLEAERAVLAAHPAALVVRTSLIYGGPRPSPQERAALAAAAGESDMTFFGDELRSPVQVGDLAAALLELADVPSVAGVLHVAGPEGVSRHEFARLVVAAAGGDPDALRTGLAAEHPEPRPLDCRLDSGSAAGLLETRLRGVREVLGA